MLTHTVFVSAANRLRFARRGCRKQGSAVLNSLMRDDVDTEVSLQTGALVCVISFGLFALSLVSSADLSSPPSETVQLGAADAPRRAGVVNKAGPPPASHTLRPRRLFQSPRSLPPSEFTLRLRVLQPLDTFSASSPPVGRRHAFQPGGHNVAILANQWQINQCYLYFPCLCHH